MDIYAEFIVKNAQSLKILSDVPWWSFSQQENTWIVKGKSMTTDGSIYSLLITDMNNTYFTTAGTTQIQKEISVIFILGI